MADWSFSCGWRCDIVDVAFAYTNSSYGNIVTVTTTADRDPTNITKQYFSMSRDRLLFLRSEDSRGRLIQNNYRLPHCTLGVLPAAKTPNEWISLLESSDEADVTAALAVIGGDHRDPAAPRQSPHEESVEQAAMVRDVRAHARVRQLIERLRSSKTDWVSQAAEIAAEEIARSARDVEPLY